MGDESGFKEDSTGKKIKFPIESYQGLEKATAERVRRFVDETKANLLRGRLESSPNLSSSRTTSDAHVETWTDDLARGHPGGPQQLVHHAHHGPHALTRGLSL